MPRHGPHAAASAGASGVASSLVASGVDSSTGGAGYVILVAVLAPASATVAMATVAVAVSGPHLPKAPRCPIFPASNAWNQHVDRLPVAADSGRIIEAVGADRTLHPDFGTGRVGIPYTTVGKGTPRVHVTFEYADESDKGPYPLPADPPVEAGSDRHVVVVDRDACRLYELFAAERVGTAWRAGSGAIWNLRSNRPRPAGWTSADAAGLPILPGLARYDEVKAGAIRHALRFTVPRTRKAFVAPARHHASSSTDRSLPPMGLRVRLKASFSTAGFGPQARVVLAALKRYGMILADNGSPWYITGAPSPRWDDDDLHALGRVKGSDLEVVGPTR